MNNPNTDADIDTYIDTGTDTCNTARAPNTEDYINPARAPNIKHNSPEVKDVCYFAERVRHMLGVKINHFRVAMDKSDNLLNSDMLMIRIQALEWVQGQIQDLILDNVTTDWPFYDDANND
jgi:hypothetical protein